ncbi:unnamed protein product [Fraxinus pennsylvanica]|uniref:Uncharacterized protein n=1 Tax=Fraxinus pennsylvanica TaxID=56036 RepID=A0AAD1YZA2_9LAMI|nr:unnamed protein product [Fraxinus pennsylvanica]
MAQPWNYIDCATAPSWFVTESMLMTEGEQFQQNYIDNSDDSSWMQLPIFQEAFSNPAMEPLCCRDCQLDEIHGFEQARQISLSFDQFITGVELPATENDSFCTGVELTSNQVDNSSTGLYSELEFPSTEYSPPNSCFSDTSMTMGEEEDFAVLIQQFQRTEPTFNSFNPDCGLMDTLGFPSELDLPSTEYCPPNSFFSDTSLTMGEEEDFAVLLQQFQRTEPTLHSCNPDYGLMDTLVFPSDVRIH